MEDGDNHVPRASQDVGRSRRRAPVLKGTLLVAGVIGWAAVIAGWVLVYLGATGHAEANVFGTKISTSSFGVVVMLCGAVVSIVIAQRLVEALAALAALPRDRRR